MQKINVGFPIDLEKLIETRALIQENSGGGKSYLMRKIIEQSYGKVPFIVLDLEGEFITLREHYDVIIFGKGHDIPINIQYADKFAQYLLELSANAIIDLSELKHHERILFVKRFLESMIDAPRRLWHNTLVFLDEAHQFCPEDSKAESMQAVIDLCTRGRKRGYCAILATQRLSKLNKDAAAELNNKMIGRTSLDVDVKRTASELGMNYNDAKHMLRLLDDGEFYVFGPAISQEVSKQKVSKANTTHAKSGTRFSIITPPSKAIQKLIVKIADIPIEVEKEKDTIKSLKDEIAQFKLNAKTNKPVTTSIHLSVVSDIKKELVLHQQFLKQYESKLKSLGPQIQKIKAGTDSGYAVLLKMIEEDKIQSTNSAIVKKAITMHVPNTSKEPVTAYFNENGSNELGRCEKAILKVLAQRNGLSTSKSQAGILSGYSSGSGGFNNSISKLRINMMIKGSGDDLAITEVGLITIGNNFEQLPTGEALHQYWYNKLGKCEKTILKILVDAHPMGMQKEGLGQVSGYSFSSGGFNNALSTLRTLELIEGRGEIKASDSLFE